MNKEQNINRYWVDKKSSIIIRKWTDEEYETIEPHKHIFKKAWTYYCPICRFIPPCYFDKKECEHDANNHKHYTGHECSITYEDREMICLEFRDEFSEDLGVWVNKQEVY